MLQYTFIFYRLSVSVVFISITPKRIMSSKTLWNDPIKSTLVILYFVRIAQIQWMSYHGLDSWADIVKRCKVKPIKHTMYILTYVMYKSWPYIATLLDIWTPTYLLTPLMLETMEKLSQLSSSSYINHMHTNRLDCKKKVTPKCIVYIDFIKARAHLLYRESSTR